MASHHIDPSLFNYDVVEIDRGKVVRVFGKGMTEEQARQCVASLQEMQAKGIAKPLKTATSAYGLRKRTVTEELITV